MLTVVKALAHSGCWVGAALPSLVPQSHPSASPGLASLLELPAWLSVSGFVFYQASLLFFCWILSPSESESLVVVEPGYMLRTSPGEPCCSLYGRNYVFSELVPWVTLVNAAGINELSTTL